MEFSEKDEQILIKFLRQAFLRMECRRNFFRENRTKNERLGLNTYECEHCGLDYRRGSVELDHTTALHKAKDTTLKFYQLFNPENWQLLCVSCHKQKTKFENRARRI